MDDLPEHTPNQKLCFILGVGQRSGTNYIYNLLKQHPACIGPGPIWQDYVLEKSSLLTEYVNHIYQRWNPNWEVTNKVAPPDTLLRYFGESIERFLRLQITNESINTNVPQEENTKQNSSTIFLTKTPSVTGLENIFEIFPEAFLILIIRDGRTVVESGVRSFDWDYEIATRKWAAAANTIYQIKKKYENTSKNFLIIKYEDLFTDEKSELIKMFNYLELNANDYNFDATAELGVTGSSDVRKQMGNVHWDATKKTQDFNPLARFKSWNTKRHDRFNWIAGKSMNNFGYKLHNDYSNKLTNIAKNKFYDALRIIITFSYKLFRKTIYATRHIRPKHTT